MNKRLIKNYQEKLLKNDYKIKREYFNRIFKKLKNHNIVIIGLRQLGKTILGEQLVKKYIDEDHKTESLDNDSLKTQLNHHNKNFLYLNLKTFNEIDKEEIQIYVNQRNFKIVFIDEIQVIKDWSNLVQVLVDSNPKTRFIFTGSNAASLSKETAFNRVKIFNLYPLNFKEFKDFWPNNNFLDFLYYGSYPKFDSYDDVMIQYLEIIQPMIVDKVVLEDDSTIDLAKFKNFTLSIANCISKEINKKQINEKENISRVTISHYLNILAKSLIVKTIPRYKSKESTQKLKVYFSDKSMSPYFLKKSFEKTKLNANDEGSLIENLVYNILAERFEFAFGSGNIYYFRNKDNKEIDFVVEKNNLQINKKIKIILEVKWHEKINTEKLSQELNNIIKDEFSDFKKIVITKNHSGFVNGWNFIKLSDFIKGEKHDI